MRLVICAVRDSAASAFMSPIFAQSQGSAMRSFKDEVNRKSEGNILNHHPEDFELWVFGEFDVDTGMFNLVERSMVLRGKDCISME